MLSSVSDDCSESEYEEWEEDEIVSRSKVLKLGEDTSPSPFRLMATSAMYEGIFCFGSRNYGCTTGVQTFLRQPQTCSYYCMDTIMITFIRPSMIRIS